MEFTCLSIAFDVMFEEAALECLEMDFSKFHMIGYSANVDAITPNETTLSCYYSNEADAQNDIPLMHAFFAQFGVDAEIVTKTLVEEEYLNAYRAFLTPQLIEHTLWIVPGHPLSYPLDDPRPKAYIDKQYAFGTGTHATTRNALTLLIRYANAVDAKARPFLDMGCGSGILAIAMGKLGYENVSCIDIDPNAILCAKENALLNAVSFTETIVGSANALKGKTFFTIGMNIETDVILELFPSVYEALLPEGALILSGIRAERKNEIERLLAGVPVTLEEEIEDEGWVAMRLMRV